MDYTKTLSALLIGVAAGAILGVLFAPDRGDKTRSKLFKMATNAGDELEELVDEGTNYAKRKMDEGKDKVSKLASDVQNKANEYASKAEDLEAKSRMKPNMS